MFKGRGGCYPQQPPTTNLAIESTPILKLNRILNFNINLNSNHYEEFNHCIHVVHTNA